MSTKKALKECENPSEVEAVEPPVFRGSKITRVFPGSQVDHEKV